MTTIAVWRVTACVDGQIRLALQVPVIRNWYQESTCCPPGAGVQGGHALLRRRRDHRHVTRPLLIVRVTDTNNIRFRSNLVAKRYKTTHCSYVYATCCAGSHLAPVIKVGVRMPSCGADAIVVMARDHSSLKLRAPAIDVSATVKTAFPPHSVQSAARTQAAAIALREPQIRGGSVHAAVRSLDVLPVLKGLQADAAANGETVLGPLSVQPARMQARPCPLHLAARSLSSVPRAVTWSDRI